jgi:nucleoside phosphorylase/tetratricopeptide (TPR) repeat protein
VVEHFIGKVEPPGRVGRVLGRIPKLPPALVGREDALRALRERLLGGQRAAITALHGLPGVGKTTLAAALVHDGTLRQHFCGGVLWAGLGPHPDVEGALDRWAADLGAELATGRDAPEKARLLAVAVRREAQGAPVLVVLDDVWAWEDAKPFVDELAFPGCALMCTTRDATIARTFAEGPETWVGELSGEDAEKLLAERCPAAMAADPVGVRALAKAVGGLPLGLSLIAGRLLESAGQARWTRDAVAELEAPEARLGLKGNDRRGTLAAIVEMSVKALDAEAQAAFAKLGAFAAKPADFGRDAALFVWDVEEKAGDSRLKALVQRGLLETAGEDRFTLHQVLADVARGRLGGEGGARERHADYHLRVVNENKEDWRRLAGELEQIRCGWGWTTRAARDDEVIAYFFSLDVFFERRGLWKERLAWAEQARRAAGRLKRSKDEADALDKMGSVCWNHGENDRAFGYYDEALRIRRTIGDHKGEAETLNNVGTVHSSLGERERALGYYNEALVIWRDIGDHEGEAETLNNIGTVHSDLKDYDHALEYYEEALHIWRDIRHPGGEADTLNNIGTVYSDLEDYDRALKYYEEALPISRNAGDRPAEATTLNNIGTVYFFKGEDERALEHYEQALPILHEVGDRNAEATTLVNIAKRKETKGDLPAAIALAAESVEITAVIRSPKLESRRAYLEALRAKQPKPESFPLAPPTPPEPPPPLLRPEPSMTTPIKLFYSYSHKDERLRDQLETHLANLKNQGVIESWHHRKILAGASRAGDIDENLEKADVILLLVSASFLASDDCFKKETARALERHAAGAARVIPILLRPVEWAGTSFAHLQALPRDARPVTKWPNRDEAWTDVANGIRGVIEALRAHPPPEPIAERGPSPMPFHASPVDFLVFAPLEEERDALLSKLPGHVKLDSDGTDVHVYFEAQVATRRKDGAVYRVVVTSPSGMGPVKAAITASAAATRWHPEHVIVVGIAGGLSAEVSLGDVMVAQSVADYTVGKVGEDGAREERWEMVPADTGLLNAANAFGAAGSEDLVATPRPEGTDRPARHAGVIASGGDVIASKELIALYRKDMPRLIGVEMEGGGVAAALHGHKLRPRFLMVRGVSDLADGEGNAAMKKRWRAYARDVAAAYVVGLLRIGPVPAARRSTTQNPR